VNSRDRNILAMVRKSLEERSAILAFQPVIDSRRPDRAAFYEALIRVIDDTGRIIPAKEFIDVCETDEIGRMIDCLALELGLKTLAEAPRLRLAVNMSARSIGYPRWMATLEKGLAPDPTIGERLIIEITESSAILMPDITRVFMDELQERGICFALDDFGAGYSAFRHLRDLDFDILKIDGDYIRGIHSQPDNRVLARALISIARQFDMLTVAESVEQQEEAQVLTEIGVDCMQGYLYGIPTTRPEWPEFPAVMRAAV
jgi:EAL domain-containing protein (putative c-di-GMP-specific phosphodiesterase class I)